VSSHPTIIPDAPVPGGVKRRHTQRPV